ncbi:MAG: tetratricopeptide repeat protein, partial [Opitutales bacterium]
SNDLSDPNETSNLIDLNAPKDTLREQVTQAYKYFESGKSDLALGSFNKALELDANDLTARLGQAMVFQEQQRHKEAFTSYDLIVQQHPTHSYAWNGRGLAAFNLENFDEALVSFKEATADQPVNGFFYESLAWTHLCRGDYREAASTAKQATLMYNQNGETAIYPLLIAYFSQLEVGKMDEAARTLKYALANKPANNAWPTPVIEFLSGQLSEPQLISYVKDQAQETEAHTYIGLQKRSQGSLEAAEPHLDWAARKGDKRVFEHTLSRTLLASNKVALLEP